MIYNNIENVRKDINYLVNKCSLDCFLLFRPSASIVNEYFSRIKRLDDEFILDFFSNFVKEFGIEVSSWKKKVIPHHLPIFVLIPSKGIRIFIEKMPDGTFKAESAEGVEYFEQIPKDSKVLELKEIKHKNSKITALKMFSKIALAQKKYVVYSIIASVSINIFALVTSLYGIEVYDSIPIGGMDTLISLSIGAFIAIFIELLLKISRAKVLDNANKNMYMEYSHQIFDKFLKIRGHALPNSRGLLSEQLQSYSTVTNYVFVDFPFAICFLSIIALIGGFELAFIIFIFLIICVIFGFLYKNRIDILSKSSTMSSYEKLGLLVETVENKTSTYITNFIQQLNYLSLIGIGAYIVSSDDKLTIGSLIAISILSNRVVAPFTAISSLFVSWSRAKIFIHDLNNLFKLPCDNEGMLKPLNPVITNADLVCNNICFTYSKDSLLLKTKYLKISHGEKIGILGVTGSGKSTLLKILAGLYKPQEGMVTLSGIDLHQISREIISKTIGYLPQNIELFSGTLRDNLILGMVGIKDEDIIEASKLSGLIDLINSLPQGLDTIVSEGETSVSSGQKQLIGLTRLVILNPDIWLLDEPTLNIDEMTEKMFFNLLNSYLTNKTLVIISHKQNYFNIVDRVLFMYKNEIILDGPKMM